MTQWLSGSSGSVKSPQGAPLYFHPDTRYRQFSWLSRWCQYNAKHLPAPSPWISWMQYIYNRIQCLNASLTEGVPI